MWLGHFVRAALLIFLAINLYAIALRYVPVPSTLLMVQRGLGGDDVRRDWTKLEDISPYMVQAVMAGEDTRFCEHEGIDWSAIEQALEDNQAGGRRRGGSTITQQTAKNVFFWNGGGYIRKAGEAWFASLIDFTWGKSRVIEVYLNVAEWGDGIFGVEAAAQNRFGKSAKNLSQQEAALLAAVLPNPHKWRLDPPSEFVQKRAGILRQRMKTIRNSGYAECVKTLELPIATSRKPVDGPEMTTPDAKEGLSSLEDVLVAAEESLKTQDTDMPPKDPQAPPIEIPPAKPEITPSQSDEITPHPRPEVPDVTPQEIPIEAPPEEIPNPGEY